MKSSTLNYLLGLLTGILLLIAYIYSPYGFIGGSTTVKVINSMTSPDGQFIATTNRAAHNSGWCEERTNVHKKDESFDWEREYVFNIDCGSEVELKWKDNKNLEVIYSYNQDRVVRIYQEFTSKNKEVNISYILKQ